MNRNATLRLVNIDLSRFTHVLTSNDISEPKPHPQDFELMITRSNANSDELVFVGDREDVDIIPTKRLGLITVMVWGKSKEADYSFDDLNAIIFRMENNGESSWDKRARLAALVEELELPPWAPDSLRGEIGNADPYILEDEKAAATTIMCLAEYLRTPPEDTVETVGGIVGIKNKAEIAARGATFAERMHAAGTVLRSSILEEVAGGEKHKSVVDMLAALDRGDKDAAAQVGWHTSPREMYDIASAMVHGRPVEWQIADLRHGGIAGTVPTGAYHTEFAIARALRTLNTADTTVCRLVYLLDDLEVEPEHYPQAYMRDVTLGGSSVGAVIYQLQHNRSPTPQPPELWADRFAVEVANVLHEQGLISDQDTPGRSFVVASRRDHTNDAQRLVNSAQVDLSKWRFTNSRQQTEYDIRELTGVLTYQDPTNKYFKHVSYSFDRHLHRQAGVRDAYGKQHEADEYRKGIMCTLGFTLPEDTHVLRIEDYSTGAVAKELTAYAAIRQLVDQFAAVSKDAKRYAASFHEMNADMYAEHNFGKDVEGNKNGMLPEDNNILELLSGWLSLRFPLGSITHDVIDIGSGPNTYLSQLAAPFVSTQSRICSLDPNPNNRQFQSAYKVGELPDALEGISHKFAQRLHELDQDVYSDCNDRARQLITVENGNIYALPKRSADLILEGFVAASISKERSNYVKALRSKAEALRDENSVSIGLEMLESDEWQVGVDTSGNPILFPSTFVTVESLQQDHNNAGLDCIVIPVGQKTTTVKLREGYKGMAIVISWLKMADDDVARRNKTFGREAWGRSVNVSLPYDL